tara:strand:- start:35 stop:415 length:381 start_codon:yes stop_codon:yes gene_type:complete
MESFSMATSEAIPILCCGDFNATPDSPTYAAMAQGSCGLELRSAFAMANGKEPTYTNFTEQYQGCLDYIWLESSGDDPLLSVVEAPSAVHEDVTLLSEDVALPSRRFPSDHLPLTCLLALRSSRQR